jgi:hypothetical protein
MDVYPLSFSVPKNARAITLGFGLKVGIYSALAVVLVLTSKNLQRAFVRSLSFNATTIALLVLSVVRISRFLEFCNLTYQDTQITFNFHL